MGTNDDERINRFVMTDDSGEINSFVVGEMNEFCACHMSYDAGRLAPFKPP
jgi:hypothetical protein